MPLRRSSGGGAEVRFTKRNGGKWEIGKTCRYYIGWVMDHARSLCAFTNPTTNSYRRLVPGYEAPVFIAWSKRNRSANIRIPMYYQGIQAAKRTEYRPPARACNPAPPSAGT